MHILIAEDDAPVAKFLSSGLESEHYEVRIATAGRQVSYMMETGQCDLIILDLNLPDISGLEVLRQVRSTRPHLPVLILTGSARVEDRVDGLDSGAGSCASSRASQRPMHRTHAQGIWLARIPHAQRRPECVALRDHSSRLEAFVGYTDQRGRCVHQLLAQKN
jgi:CheY-like chemotaxis protein